MSAPVAYPDPVLRLQTVAGWDVVSLRAGLHALTALDEGFPAWRSRLDAVVRELEQDGCWSGPAAAQAGELLVRLSSAAAALDLGFAASREECARLAREAATAAERAATALALARELPMPLDAALAAEDTLAASVDRLVLGPGSVPPAVATAREALSAVTAVEAAAGRAGEVLVPAAATGPAAWLDALAGVDPVRRPPAGGDPAATAHWWAALPIAAQLTLVESQPRIVGSSDGVPAWARDRANRHALRQVLADPRADEDHRATARVVAEVLAAEEDAGRVAQLHLLDLDADRVAVAFGDLDSAEAVALVVPGIYTSPEDDLAGVAGDARDLATAARHADSAAAVAAMAWLGYRAPHTVPAVLTRGAAVRGGALLDAALAGLAGARSTAGTALPRTTVVGHSYGTVVLDEAADRPGRLAADAVVLLGSPGMEDDAAALEAPEVYDAASAADPISWSGWFGTETWAGRFGSTGLPTDPGTGHSGYFDRDRPTLAAMGEVVVGRRAG
ncbi:Alpha/beta hydrolase [Blastococcus aurantiacus]|uniref:Alpha/beta hydrolase n=1 Tax=Blastococcus aurantiacus TaxID=1550231 RepID=A0A1G7MHP3_9ACTN|nr:alpha/beta hydrolase [Blastococcus aurantiacus]SDF61322.1 Alpha/beta hydrolase [Blastococcus aurantiacus]